MVAVKKARLWITLAVALLLGVGTVVAIYFARGYRPNLGGGQTTIEGTGLLAASSYPEQSSVFIDDKLVTTTNDTVNLLPGSYKVKIEREGFISWEKTLLIEKELVTLTNARLFPAVPSLTALTTSGAKTPTPSPDGQRIAYLVTGSSLAENNGLFVLATGANPLGLERKPTQIARDGGITWSSAVITWSPDSRQILLALPTADGKAVRASYLLETDRLNQIRSMPDVTVRLPFIFSGWEQDLIKRDSDLVKNLPEFMFNVASSSATNIYFSPDGEKMLYTATKELVIPDNLIPPLASVNSTIQTRILIPNSLYVYDLKEDTNYSLGSAATQSAKKPLLKKLLVDETATTSTPAGVTRQTLSTLLQENLTPLETIAAFKAYYHGFYTNSPQWYPTSRHLITTADNKITIFEYDNTNQATVYSGPFAEGFVFPAPDGHRLYFLTNLSQTTLPENLYIIDLK